MWYSILAPRNIGRVFSYIICKSESQLSKIQIFLQNLALKDSPIATGVYFYYQIGCLSMDTAKTYMYMFIYTVTLLCIFTFLVLIV